ncbi:MAG: glycosyltransferase family 4 protein, partial [Gammaproteobacteria bacterium]|nr:glycosyltransferase family 4 protein [Gammaproteobacteria bacterium]
MKIAFFSGPVEYSVCLANALSEYCDVDFFYGARYAKQRDESILSILNPNVKRIPINEYRIRDIRNLWNYYKIARKLRNYNIIHVQSGNIWFSLWRFYFRKVPIVCTIHDPYQHIGLRKSNSKYQDMAQKWIISQSLRFIVHGRKMKEAFSKRYRFPMDKIMSIPHGEFSFYKKFRMEKNLINKKDSDDKRILFFGIVRKNKGLEYLIKAEPFISDRFSNYKICIAGKFQEDFDYYNDLIQNRNKFEIIDEYIPNNQVANLFENSDIVVLPYIMATQSGVLPLAFGFGKPVIATDTGSISEILEHGKTGLLIPPCNEKLLA